MEYYNVYLYTYMYNRVQWCYTITLTSNMFNTNVKRGCYFVQKISMGV